MSTDDLSQMCGGCGFVTDDWIWESDTILCPDCRDEDDRYV